MPSACNPCRAGMIDRLLKLAWPVASVMAVAGPVKVPDDKVKLTTMPDTTLPYLSVARTTTVRIVAPLLALTGWVEKDSIGAATITLKELDDALETPVADMASV